MVEIDVDDRLRERQIFFSPAVTGAVVTIARPELSAASRRGPYTSRAFSTKMRRLSSLRAAGMKSNAAEGLSKSQCG